MQNSQQFYTHTEDFHLLDVTRGSLPVSSRFPEVIDPRIWHITYEQNYCVFSPWAPFRKGMAFSGPGTLWWAPVAAHPFLFTPMWDSPCIYLLDILNIVFNAYRWSCGAHSSQWDRSWFLGLESTSLAPKGAIFQLNLLIYRGKLTPWNDETMPANDPVVNYFSKFILEISFWCLTVGTLWIPATSERANS